MRLALIAVTVLVSGIVAAATGFDCDEPRSRRYTVNRISTPTDRNSLCQFWKLSNQNVAEPK